MTTPEPFDDDVSSDLTGQYLKQADLPNGKTLTSTIVRVEKTHFEASNGRPASDKWVVLFEDGSGLPLNQTNLKLLAKWFGTRANAWIGQSVTVYVDESVSFGGRLVGGLRLRRSSAAAVEPAAAAPKKRGKSSRILAADDDAPPF